MTTAERARRLAAAEAQADKVAPPPEMAWLDYLTIDELTDLDELMQRAGAHTFDDLSEPDQMRARSIALRGMARMAEAGGKP